ncbi:PASTA domain-containing protein [Nocardioides sp. dk4132]|uniref:transglycosylase domain-containing protein n=1 Tax=unclassified Nocardioides TaxID=2615069 RepID=UPI001297C39B|nr:MULTISPECIES: transglycosylase domain-containing protein [unclassified Nocardioides]MQW75249.1 PASTA domain-containing protein [Nocardioides sp. dk4132]QGA07600.1 PASTA domain-containing protein [Nocardioides sp. dk884]
MNRRRFRARPREAPAQRPATQPPAAGLDDLLVVVDRHPARPGAGPLARSAGLVVGVLTLVTCLALLPFTLVLGGVAQHAIRAWDGIGTELPPIQAKQRTVLLDRDGRQWGQLFTENRVATELSDISPHVVAALLATEDSRFYEHGAVDLRGVARALVNNVVGADLQGASTLSQQLVENLRILNATTDDERRVAKASTLGGKIAELKLAGELERRYSKDEILEAYLNVVYLGNGAYGVEAAARRYFSTSAADLSIKQAATLVAMLKSPSAYDPITHPGRSRQRRDVVMARMVAEGALTRERFEKLRRHPTPIQESRPRSGCAASEFPYYCAMLIEHVLRSPEFGETREDRQNRLNAGGLEIRTALDAEAMRAAEEAVDAGFGRTNRVGTGIAVMEPGTGQVVAIAQNRTFGTPEGKDDPSRTQVVYATSEFQTGSTFKPVTLAAALESGMSVRTTYDTPSGLYVDGLDAPEGGYKNDDRQGHGVLDAYGAMRGSVNTYFVQMVADAGVRETAAVAQRLGLTSIPEDLSGREGSLTLGAFESSPLQLATAYATLAARGVRCDPVLILSARDVTTGEDVDVPDGDCHQAISPAVAVQVSDVLRAPFDAGGTASSVRLGDGRPAGGKTGTTDDAAAVWFAGYTPQYAAAVWVGDPRGGQAHPLTGVYAHGYYHSVLYGGTGAGPVWRRTMEAIHEGLAVEEFPPIQGAGAVLVNTAVPSVVGMGIDEAVTLLAASGFEVRVRQRASETAGGEADHVAEQEPAAGTAVGRGAEVLLTLTAGSETSLDLRALTAEGPGGGR